MSFKELRASNRRLAILQFLEGEADYKMNTDMLKQVLATIGDTVSTVGLSADIAWLKESGCIESEVFGSITVVKILERGVDAAAGAAQIEGIARPKAS